MPLAAKVALLSNVAPPNWVPGPDAVVTDVVSLCCVLARIDSLTAASTNARIFRQLSDDGWIDDSLTAELNAAALLRPWCDEVEWLAPSKTGRQADLRLKCGSATVSVEVTHAAVKPGQALLAQIADQIFVGVTRDVRGRRFVVHFLDALSPVEIETISVAAARLHLGTKEEVVGRWSVAVTELSETIAPSPLPPPTWWPEQFAEPVSFGGTFSIADGIRRANQIEIHWGLSVGAYINPLQKKADRPQAEEGKSSIIALDASSLPGALHWFPKNLSGYLPLWSRVSGVLIFQRCVSLPPARTWLYWFGKNVSARSALPTQFDNKVGYGRDDEPFWPLAGTASGGGTPDANSILKFRITL